MKVLLWIALTMSLATGVLAVRISWWLKNGYIIAPDSRNEVEFYCACGILFIQFVAWLWFIVWVLRGKR